MVLTTPVTIDYGFAQAGADLSQVLPLVAVTVALLVAMVLDLLLPARRRSAASGLITVAGFAAALVLAWWRWSAGGGGPAYSGFATGDRFAVFFESLFSVLGLLTVLTSSGYLRRRGFAVAEFNVLLLASVAGMMVLASATSLVTIFLGLELLSISLYVASAYARGERASQEAGAKYLLMGGFASAFVLYGMALTYGATGTSVISEIAVRAASAANPLLVIGILLMGAGFAFKVSAAPFHMWTPDVYQGAPLPVTAFMSVGTKAAAFAMIIRVFSAGLPHLSPDWQALLAFVAAASLLVGNLMALVQTSLKRLLAYSGVAHAGYILIGVVAGGRNGVGGVLFYLFGYLFMNFGAFAILTGLSRGDHDLDDVSELDGLAYRRPFYAVLMTLFMFSLAGFPPTVGFFGKFLLFEAGVAAGYSWLVILAVLMSVVSVYYYFQVVRHMWTRNEALVSERVPLGAGLAIVSVGALSLLAGIVPYLLLLFGQSGAAPVLAGSP